MKIPGDRERGPLLAAMMLVSAPCAYADVVTDANAKAADIASKNPPPPSRSERWPSSRFRIRGRRRDHGALPPYGAKVTAAPGASVDAAVAAATRTVLLKLMPDQQAAIDADYRAR